MYGKTIFCQPQMVIGISIMALLLNFISFAHGGEFDFPYDPARILVRFKPGTSTGAQQTAHTAAAVQQVVAELTDGDTLVLVRVPEGTVPDALTAYRANANVDSATLDYLYTFAAVPTDSRFEEQWGERNTGQAVNGHPAGVYDADIDLTMAWGLETGDPNLIVAVLDNGVAYDHVDFHNGDNHNIWVNLAECPGGYETCVTNDQDEPVGSGNGFNDDFYGYDFFAGDSDPRPSANPGNDHGTEMAGIIGARANSGSNSVAGAMWDCKIMAVRVGQGTTIGVSSGAATLGVRYARMNGAKVINASWSGRAHNSQLYQEISLARDAGIVFVAAAGHYPSGDTLSANLDAHPQYPASYGVTHTNTDLNPDLQVSGLSNVIAVAATTNYNNRWDHTNGGSRESNYGATHVHIGAPGYDVLTTFRNNAYGFVEGTSAATAYVSGVVGLLRSRSPSSAWTPEQIRERLILTKRPMASLAGKTVAGGEVNAHKALLYDCNGNGVEDLCDVGCPGDGVTTCNTSNCGTVDQRGWKSDCCFAHLSPGCTEEVVTEDIIQTAVCGIIPACCTDFWSRDCAIQASAMFPITCLGIPDGIPDSCQATRDCNCNGIIEYSGEVLPDSDFDGIPNVCESVPFLRGDPTGLDKCRFISFVPGAACPSGDSAIRVTLTSLHHVDPPYSGGAMGAFTAFEGQVRWVGPPTSYIESTGDPTPFLASQLQCTPHYRDWTTIGLLYVTGSAIVPSSAYEVRMVGENCEGTEETCVSVSSPVIVGTTRWGDVETPYNPPSVTAQPDVGDISALVDKFQGMVPDAPIKARGLLGGESIFGDIDIFPDLGFGHISACVDAFRGGKYPYQMGMCTSSFNPCTFDTDCAGATGPCKLFAMGKCTGAPTPPYTGNCTSGAQCTGSNGAGPCIPFFGCP
jgi:subtilisin family serine protease